MKDEDFEVENKCLRAALRASEEECERERIRLAGCGIAALDASQVCDIKPGDYAHSASLEDVRTMRRKLDVMRPVFEWAVRVDKCHPDGTSPGDMKELRAALARSGG